MVPLLFRVLKKLSGTPGSDNTVDCICRLTLPQQTHKNAAEDITSNASNVSASCWLQKWHSEAKAKGQQTPGDGSEG